MVVSQCEKQPCCPGMLGNGEEPLRNICQIGVYELLSVSSFWGINNTLQEGNIS